MTYAIIEDQQAMDGMFYHTKDALFSALPYAGTGAKVVQFDLVECLRDNSTPMREVTEDIVREAYAANVFDDPDTHRLGIAGDYITFPPVKYHSMLEQVA